MTTSINTAIDSSDVPDWSEAGLRWYSYGFHLRKKYGQRVQRVSLDAGFTCPNVDGTVAKGGCVFCDNRSFSPSRRVPRTSILGQLEEGIRRVKLRYKTDAFIAYFQPATNTYASVDRLRPLYEEALAHPKVLGLCVGTRPDCVPDDVLDLLQELAADSYVSVEYGLQTIHDRSLEWMNRGHGYDAYLDAMERSRGRGFEICAHVILGLPGESREDMRATARAVAASKVDSVKIHNLYAVKNTPLADWVTSGEVTLISREEYIAAVADALEELPPGCVVERVTGEAPPDYLVAPEWCRKKHSLRDAIEQELKRRDSRQGSKWQASRAGAS
ncbi:MAG: TIGR01212 family radical SAM protein [Planctomycetales bacterium]